MVDQTSLIGYAMNYTAFLLDSKLGKRINRIILFGSVARGDFDHNSDVDIFVDTDENIEKEVQKNLILFKSSKIYQIWKLKNIPNEISIKVGKLNNWDLKREIISSGVLLYGKYSELPENLNYYMMIKLESMKKKPISKQVKIWRKLYGYRQKVGHKIYHTEGLVEKSQGMKIGKTIIIIPMEKRNSILEFLTKNKVNYRVFELWSDSFTKQFK